MTVPPLENMSLPIAAEERWPGKHKSKETLETFFERVWSKYLPIGLDRKLLKRLDPTIVLAIRDFPKTEKRPWPEKFKVPNNRTKLAEAIDRWQKSGWQALSHKEKVSVVCKLARDGFEVHPSAVRPPRSGRADREPDRSPSRG